MDQRKNNQINKINKMNERKKKKNGMIDARTLVVSCSASVKTTINRVGRISDDGTGENQRQYPDAAKLITPGEKRILSNVLLTESAHLHDKNR